MTPPLADTQIQATALNPRVLVSPFQQQHLCFVLFLSVSSLQKVDKLGLAAQNNTNKRGISRPIPELRKKFFPVQSVIELYQRNSRNTASLEVLYSVTSDSLVMLDVLSCSFLKRTNTMNYYAITRGRICTRGKGP